MRLFEWLTPEERRRFNFDVSRINWRHYIHVHIAGIKKHILKVERAGTLEVEEDVSAEREAVRTINDLLRHGAEPISGTRGAPGPARRRLGPLHVRRPARRGAARGRSLPPPGVRERRPRRAVVREPARVGRGLPGRRGDRARRRAARLPDVAPGGLVGGGLHRRARHSRVARLLRAADRRGAGPERARRSGPSRSSRSTRSATRSRARSTRAPPTPRAPRRRPRMASIRRGPTTWRRSSSRPARRSTPRAPCTRTGTSSRTSSGSAAPCR